MVDFAKLNSELRERRALGPTLTIKDGKFRLYNPTKVLLSELTKSSEWLSAGLEAYETTSLRAAAEFSRHADEKAKAFFAKTFQEHYDLPLGCRPGQMRELLPFLDPHQGAGVEWILTRKRSYLAHAPGAGKTAQAICARWLAPEVKGDIRPALVLCPPDLVENWRREIEKFTDLVMEARDRTMAWPMIGVVGRSENRDRVAWRGDFLIVPFSMLTKDWVYSKLLEIDPRFIIVDEASALKESTTDRSLAFYGGRYKGTDFPGLYRRARHVVFMDGSPMPNRPMELWAPLYALVPETIDCMSQRDFGFRYCGGRMNERGEYEFKYSSNEDELRARMRKDFMHVVTEDELDHPERRRSILFMSEDVRTPEIKDWERRNLSRVLKLVAEGEEDPDRGEIAAMRCELGKRKAPWVASYVRRLLKEKNEQILLYAWHRDVCLRLEHELLDFSPGLVMGGTPAKERERHFAKFQEGSRRLIIGNIAAMGRGHNLQNADRVLFAEYSWSDEQNRQAEKRASRRGSTKKFVRCEYIAVPNSMDEKVLGSIFTKQGRVKRVIG